MMVMKGQTGWEEQCGVKNKDKNEDENEDKEDGKIRNEPRFCHARLWSLAHHDDHPTSFREG